MKRRDFTKSASAAIAGSIFMAPDFLKAEAWSKRISPNDKLQIGVIGCNGMGWSNTSPHLKMKNVDLVAICDVDTM